MTRNGRIFSIGLVIVVAIALVGYAAGWWQ